MKKPKSSFIIIGSVGLLLLGACSNTNQTVNTENSPVSSTSSAKAPSVIPSPVAKKTNSPHGESKGGQVVETGTYHLEFLAEKETNATHMDLYLQTGDNHEAVPNAKVIAQVQLPDGKQKSIPLTYDVSGKHYTAMLSENISGQYQVKITADIKGEKVDGRFNFNR
ncbi:hypothetical protein [Nostoc sp. FACHB-888]|uniref:hypothetical protein n=1 Tax=Nostoc sp. FACHB-888 TaxID=2692842 RepID=UPI0016894A79|nr:hypothetical protein [Nostoc sp. FACHB-888]MBD2247004.1 hypothetical protein [Nostoc sp. FACHB-888]MCC5653835.1 hypothetical protein [Nostoc sp. XA013]